MNIKNKYDILIFKCLAGSRLYGTATPESDTDYRGVFVPPVLDLLNPFKEIGIQVFHEEFDEQLYPVHKFFVMAEKANPNIIELFYAENMLSNPVWDLIRDNSDAFLSKRIKGTFLGYANQQLQRIDRHLKWVQNPPTKPSRKEYGLPIDGKILNETQLGAIRHIPKEAFKEEIYDGVQAEIAYAKHKSDWNAYQKWLRERNPARAELERKIGYDAKHGMHLIRLYQQGLELAVTKRIEFPLKCAETLRAIRNCEVSLEELMQIKNDNEVRFITALDHSDLPDKPDRERLLDLYYHVLEI